MNSKEVTIDDLAAFLGLHYVLFVKLLTEYHAEYDTPTRGERVRYHCERWPPQDWISMAFSWKAAPGGASLWAKLDEGWQERWMDLRQKRMEELAKNKQP
ncbi:MAG: hypothetical protein LBP56_00210 [Odoribacteraceae bacterium]|jgi:hypothetical protein|nr:hypothetical protein [Odoribacteraceae bacterium]